MVRRWPYAVAALLCCWFTFASPSAAQSRSRQNPPATLVAEETGRLAFIPGTLGIVIWRDRAAMVKGMELLVVYMRNGNRPSDANAVVPYTRCIVMTDGTRVAIVGSEGSGSSLSYEVVVVEGKEVGCRDVIPRINLK